MCGICGFVGNGNIGDLNRMNAALIHRGPDAEGTWHDSNKGVYDLVLERKLLSQEELDRILAPENMIRPK